MYNEDLQLNAVFRYIHFQCSSKENVTFKIMNYRDERSAA